VKRKNKQTEEQKVNIGDYVVYFAQTYTVVETDVDFTKESNPQLLLHIKAVEYPFKSLWVKCSDVVINKGECNES